MLGVLRNVAAIVGSREIAPRMLASTYGEMRVLRVARLAPRRVRVLDWKVAYSDYAAVVRLFEEIFIRRHYPFSPRQPRPFVVDCGAHIGMSVLYVKSLVPQAEILAFEPEPTAFRLLVENMRSNGITGVECVPRAVAKEAGRRILRTAAPAHGGASIEFGGVGWREREVEAIRLSDRIGGRRVDFLKLDVEGSELAVLDDLSKAGVLDQVDEIALEHHPRRASDLPVLLDILASAGFEYRIAAASDAFWDPGQLLLLHAFRAQQLD
jgi:FkbM family methyltransferase